MKIKESTLTCGADWSLRRTGTRRSFVPDIPCSWLLLMVATVFAGGRWGGVGPSTAGHTTSTTLALSLWYLCFSFQAGRCGVVEAVATGTATRIATRKKETIMVEIHKIKKSYQHLSHDDSLRWKRKYESASNTNAKKITHLLSCSASSSSSSSGGRFWSPDSIPPPCMWCCNNRASSKWEMRSESLEKPAAVALWEDRKHENIHLVIMRNTVVGS